MDITNIIKDRFFAKVEKTDSCWLWTGSKDTDKYGLFRVGKVYTAHRVSYVIHNGPIPYGAHICHSCDVRHCVNPDHLWAGNHQLNMADKMAKGRHVVHVGEDHHAAKLTKDQVLAMRRQYKKGGVTYRELGEQYGIHRGAVGLIIRKENWSHI